MFFLTPIRIPILITFIWLLTSTAIAAPVNDNIAQATIINALPYTNTQTTIAATQESGELTPTCLKDATASVWYQYTATEAQTVSFDTFGSNYDTVLSVWQGTGHPLTAIDCGDDASGSQIQSYLTVNLTPGSYYIQINGYQGEGTLILNAKAVNAMTNDALAKALTIKTDETGNYHHTQQTNKATLEANEIIASCGKGNQGGVWYQYKPDTNQTVVFDTLSSDYNTILSVWTGARHPLTEIACDDDDSGSNSALSLALSAGTNYYINIAAGTLSGGGLLAQTGLLNFNMTAPPINDNLAQAIEIKEVLPYTVTQSTLGATKEEGEFEPSCSPGTASVWYKYKPASNMDNLIISTRTSSYDTVLSIWDGFSRPRTEIACNDDFSIDTVEITDMGKSSQVTVAVKKGTTYFINVSSAYGDMGNLILTLKEGQRDFNIDSQTDTLSIYEGKTATLTVALSPIEGVRTISAPIIYQWYQGKAGNTDTPIGENAAVLITPALTETTQYWVHISNPTGSISSDTLTVTTQALPTETIDSNGIGVNTKGEKVFTIANFVGIVTKSLEQPLPLTQIAQADDVFVTGTITVDSNHIGQKADIIVVGIYISNHFTGVYMRYNTVWQEWRTMEMADLLPAQENIELSATMEVPIFNGKFQTMPGSYKVYVGYRLNSNNDIIYSGQPIEFTVE